MAPLPRSARGPGSRVAQAPDRARPGHCSPATFEGSLEERLRHADEVGSGSLPSYDAAATRLVTERVLDFLGER